MSTKPYCILFSSSDVTPRLSRSTGLSVVWRQNFHKLLSHKLLVSSILCFYKWSPWFYRIKPTYNDFTVTSKLYFTEIIRKVLKTWSLRAAPMTDPISTSFGSVMFVINATRFLAFTIVGFFYSFMMYAHASVHLCYSRSSIKLCF